MEEKPTLDIEINDEVGRFTESYSSFTKVINRLQSQYLTLKEVYTRQSEELQSVNRTLQSMAVENRAVTEFLNSILNSLASGVIAVNKSGMISHINPAARRILGLSYDIQCRNGLPYDNIIKAVSGEDVSALNTVHSGRIFDRSEKKIVSSDNRTLTLSVSTSVLQTSDGRVVGAVEMFHDISKIKSMEEQLSRMRVLASLGEMAASIAHEVRNPLVVVSGFASLLVRDCAEDKAKADMARKIVDGVTSINSTIQTLLDFARHETLHKSDVDLHSYLELICQRFGEEQGIDDLDSIIIRDLKGREEIRVDVDRQLFRQAVLNILKNAYEASRDNPMIMINTRLMDHVKAAEQFKDRLELAGGEDVVIIEIDDNGPGITPDAIERIFSPFYSTKEHGNGLGLAISWKIIKAHCGDLNAESLDGKGTRFCIVLPAKT